MLDDCFNRGTGTVNRAYPWGAQDMNTGIGKLGMNKGDERQGHNCIPNPMRGDNEDAWHSEAPFWDDLSDREVPYQESRDIQCRNTGI